MSEQGRPVDVGILDGRGSRVPGILAAIVAGTSPGRGSGMSTPTGRCGVAADRLTLDDRRDICALPVTLGGCPAIVYGALASFAMVTTIPAHAPESAQGEWSWATVLYVLAFRGGAFRL